jgi:serine kinase of HPr protein (carbohydrate metabolism regulator)
MPIADGSDHHILHATIIAIKGHAVLLRGPSGAGKSDLALRLIDRGATLVADDYARIVAQQGTLLAEVLDNIAGQIEVRGIGIVSMPFQERACIRLVVDLATHYPRMPDKADATTDLLGVQLARIAINPFEASAPYKVELALMKAISSDMNDAS